ncbi:hypothetical protein QSI_2671 [Clostridioides difficile P28]|nr:hypothetical protein QSI_2671 [Clostridioides difficile P28]
MKGSCQLWFYSLFHDDMRKRIGIERIEFYVIHKHLYVSLDGL